MVITTEGKIKLLLLRSGKNQGDLADYLGVMKQSLNLSIKSGGLRYSVLQKIAEFFNSELDVYFIVDGKRYTQSDMSIPKQLHEIATEKCIYQKVNQTDLGRKG